MANSAPPYSVPFVSAPRIQLILDGVGRTEDIKFSPDARRLAIADFGRNRIVLLGLDLQFNGHVPRIEVTQCASITSAALKQPHGLCFLDTHHLLVACRGGEVLRFELPFGIMDRRHWDLEPAQKLSGRFFSRIQSPGSLCCQNLGDNQFRVFVCNNYINKVSAHVLRCGPSPRVLDDRYLLNRDLDVPDGINISASRRWLIVSNHNTGEVFIYDLHRRLTPTTRAHGVLQEIAFPHGILFTPDDRQILVADAGSPFLHIFRSEDGDWSGKHPPWRSLRVLDDATFQAGHYNQEEGGIKGIDIDPSGILLASTCEHRVLSFHDLRRLAGSADAMPTPDGAPRRPRRDERPPQWLLQLYNSPIALGIRSLLQPFAQR